ncbi:hypothetical protein M885DRAFT_99879 [Pelagophyceae sp. CCMP2097]|nr:hypothetical protein M885DRAFT_99879 [Pelagophyceae sp. CCMP2097]
MRRVLEALVDTAGRVRVVSVGAGLDAEVLRLLEKYPKQVTAVELDVDDVALLKREAIAQCGEARRIIDCADDADWQRACGTASGAALGTAAAAGATKSAGPRLLVSTEAYRLVSVDVRGGAAVMDAALLLAARAGDVAATTVVVSEVALVYVDGPTADAVRAWAARECDAWLELLPLLADAPFSRALAAGFKAAPMLSAVPTARDAVRAVCIWTLDLLSTTV